MISINNRTCRNILIAMAGLFLSACAVTPKPLTSEQLLSQAIDDSREMFDQGEALEGRLTFSSAVARTLNYNLDKKAKLIEEALAFKRSDLASYDQLPGFVANAGYVIRDRKLASSSEDLSSGTSGSPSFSMDRQNGTIDLGMAWNILDFGLSYYQAKSMTDRALIAFERRRKAEHALISEARSAYWRAAAYQLLSGPIRSVLADAKRALSDSKAVEDENLKSPMEALRYQKALLETMRQMTVIQQQLSSAPYELAALIGVNPAETFSVSVPNRLRVPHWNMPASQMTEIAFLHNPDIHEQAYLARIAANDSHAEFLKALPGIGVAANMHYDSNSFLVNNFWTDIGPKLSWNLIKFASLPKISKTSKLNEEAVKARRLAVRMAIFAQVFIADRQFKGSIEMFRQADSLWRVDSRLARLLSQRAEADASGGLERISAKASSIVSQLRRFEAYARMQKAYGRLQQTLGRDLLPVQNGGHTIQALADEVELRLAVWEKGDRSPELKLMMASASSKKSSAMPSSAASPAITLAMLPKPKAQVTGTEKDVAEHAQKAEVTTVVETVIAKAESVTQEDAVTLAASDSTDTSEADKVRALILAKMKASVVSEPEEVVEAENEVVETLAASDSTDTSEADKARALILAKMKASVVSEPEEVVETEIEVVETETEISEVDRARDLILAKVME